MTTPRLPAVRIDTGQHTAPNTGPLAVWCEWCERAHHHGGPYGMRGRHCDPGAGTPHCSYELTEGGAGKSAKDALPATLFVGTGHTLRKAIRHRGAALRHALACIMLGEHGLQGATLCKTGRRGAIEVKVGRGSGLGPLVRAPAHDDWRYTSPDGREVNGRGLLDLAGMLFGVSPGAVAVRTLEATLGLHLDAEAADIVCGAIAAWDARGRPGPKDGVRTRA